MFSKRLLIALIAAFAAPACTLKLNEEKPKTLSMAVSPVDEGCLSNADEVFNQFFEGQISERDLVAFWDCLYKSFEMFVENTQGKSADHYAVAELQVFLEKYFLGGKKLHPELVSEAMALKRAIVGGSSSNITKAELRETLSLMRVFREQSLKVRPFMPFSEASILANPPSEATFDDRAQIFHTAAEEIGRAMSRSVGEYPFANLESLLKELGTYLYGSVENTWLGGAVRSIQIVRASKAILIGPPEDRITKTDWISILRLGPRYYTLWLRWSLYFRNDNTIFWGKGLRHLSRFAETARDYLLESIQNHPSQKISFDEINRLARALEDQKLLPIKAPTVEALLISVAGRVFRDLENPIAAPFNGFNKVVVDRLFDRWLLWIEGQFFLEGSFRQILGEDWAHGSVKARRILAIPESDGLKFTRYQNEISLAAIREVRRNVISVSLVHPGQAAHIVIPKNRGNQDLSLSHLTRLNWTRAAARLVVQGYAAELDRAKNQQLLSKEEAMVFYDEVFPALRDLGFLETFNRNTVINRVTEADLFLPSADGDDHISSTEGTELLVLAFSSIERANAIHGKIADLCKVARDVKDRPIDTRCFRKFLVRDISTHWDFLPGMRDWFLSLPEDQTSAAWAHPEKPSDAQNSNEAEVMASRTPRADFIHMIDTIVRQTNDVWNRPVLSGDTLGMVLMMYYMESLFYRFDADGSGTLSKAEAWSAYPVFRNFLAEKAAGFGLDKEEDFEALFHFLLKYQQLPNEGLLNKLRYFRERYLWKTSYETDRMGVARIFSRLLKL